MRRSFARIAVVGLALLLVAAFAFRFVRHSPAHRHAAAASSPTQSAAPRAAAATPQPHSAAVGSTVPSAKVTTSPPPLPKPVLPAATSATAAPHPPAPDDPAMIEIDKVGLMIRDYRTLAGENPVGTNAEIMAALMGENPKHATLGPPAGMSLNEKGELLDRWGTPYFFHQLSRDHMEIHSAGPDKVMWTEDDPIVR